VRKRVVAFPVRVLPLERRRAQQARQIGSGDLLYRLTLFGDIDGD
jgi:hypothetical protein